MSSAPDKQHTTSFDGLDVNVLSNLIRGMNLAARNLVAYPGGHPLVTESYEKVEGLFRTIFESRRQLTFRITRDTLVLGSKLPDRKHPLFRSFAQALFRHGIVGLTLLQGLTSTELMAFDRIISKNRDDAQKEGGIQNLLLREKVHHIRASLVDYGVFQAEDDLAASERDDEYSSPPSIWGKFVKELFAGAIDPARLGVMSPHEVDPADLASLLNSAWGGQDGQIPEGLNFDVLFSKDGGDVDRLADDEELLGNLVTFLQSLDDSLRPTFLERFFNSLEENNPAAGHILSILPAEIIIDALEKHANRQMDIAPNILDILQRLNEAAGDHSLPGPDGLLTNHSREELVEKFRTIFKEDEVDRFVPLDYQRVLHDCITAEDLSAPELFRFRQLAQTLTGPGIEARLLSVMVDLITARGLDNVPDSLKNGLRERCTKLIRNGEFHLVSDVLETIAKKEGHRENEHDKGSHSFTALFSDKSFVEEVLKAAALWGREKQFHIIELIKALGSPLVEPLLDRLAVEEDRTLRRFYLDLLVALGGMVRDQAIERLQDQRWYVVRNIVTLLRQLNDPTVLPSIHGILDHPHPKVRHEILHTLVKFNDPISERLLLEEMEAGDTGRCLRAINLAGATRSREVSEKLVGLLKKRGLKAADLNIKKASVHALAEIGDPSVLPVLQHIVKARSWFAREKTNLLKLEIIKSLGKYPPAHVSSILAAVANSGTRILANQAALIINNLKENTRDVL